MNETCEKARETIGTRLAEDGQHAAQLDDNSKTHLHH